MALPPSIPTSFIPHPGSAAPRQFRSNLSGAFGYFAYGFLAIAVAIALGVFAYGRILDATLASKDAAVAEAQSKIDRATVERFVRLRDRLVSSESLLGKHAAFSGLFGAFEKLLPSSVRLMSLHLSMSDAGAAKLEGSGTARSFNALAAASNAFADDGRVKDAIFSNISVKEGIVSFELSAKVDPALIAFTPGTISPTPISATTDAKQVAPTSESQPQTP